MEKQPSEARVIFAKNMRYYRRLRKITLMGLQGLTGLTYGYLGEVERLNVNISLDNMEKIVKALDVPLAKMFE
jgi:transcriptional regulator with XRE-family HTH domain